MKLKDKVALITGVSSGIGYESALLMAKEGCSLALHYNSNNEGAEKCLDEIKKIGVKCILIQADLTTKDACDMLVKKAADEFSSRIDILVHNAGTIRKRILIEDVTDDYIDFIVNLNLKSFFWITRAVVPLMKNQGGNMIFISSVAARNGGGPGASIYASCKGGVLTFTKSMAKELAKYNIRVNGIAPGVIETPFHDVTPKEEMENFANAVPVKRNGSSREIAGAVLFLASEDSSFMTGSTMEINGGMYML